MFISQLSRDHKVAGIVFVSHHLLKLHDMFSEIFLFDLNQNFKKPQTYVFFGIFLLLTLLLGLAVAGVFDIATTDTNVIMNSANAVAGVIVGLNDGILGLVNSVILVAVMATAIQKDYEYNTHPLYFTKPISKGGYFFGRFLSALCTAWFVFSGQIIGYWLGTLAGIGKPIMGAFELMNFVEPFLIFTIPNVLLLGVIFFSLTTFMRSTLPAYLFAIVLLVLGFVTSRITADLDNKTVAALIEPFGMQALTVVTEYWTPEEQNIRGIPLSGVLLYNRLLWLGVALLITIFSYVKFEFSQFLNPVRWFKKSSTETTTTSPASVHLQTLASLPKVAQRFSVVEQWRQLLYLAAFECKKIVRSPFFIIIMALGIVTMFIIAQFMGSIYDTETYPVTYQIIEIPASFFQLFMLILLVFMSGTLIWRDREQKTDELIGTTPVSNTVLYFSKYLALVYIVGIMLITVCATGMAIQLSQGYYNLELGLYVKFALRSLVSYAITAGLCLTVQVYSPNKYLGFFLSLVPLLFINILFSQLEWTNQLYYFNSSGPEMSYSDMNGYGHVGGIWLLYKLYWGAMMAVFSLLALMFFARGKEKGLKARYRLSKGTNSSLFKWSIATCLLIVVSAGAYIFYNTNILHTNKTAKQREQEQVTYERQYKRYQSLLQPRIVSSEVAVDIYPEDRKLTIKGHYYLKNKHRAALDTLFINYLGKEDIEYSFSKLQPAVPASIVLNDTEYGVQIFKLQQALQPGDSIRFDFELAYMPIGFANGTTNTEIVYNGTFFNNLIFPSVGYNSDAELSENAAREKYGLAYKPRMADVNDSAARMNNYISHDADWVHFAATVSTSEDQIAIAPGYLQKEWTANGRRYFRYQMDSPILNFYSFLSARYEVKRDQWQDVAIEVYYHKGHEYNLDRMIKSVKQSLEYYTTQFGPYQHRQVRILEFPRYASFAQAFPNTIPYSEGIGFIAKVDATNSKIDVPFYVTAHEVAHQWWAHQVMGGNVQGSVLMSETMSQYSALMVMEKEYGKPAMRKFLKYELDKYLTGRTAERKKELPLMLCENQDYIHYNKGSVVMYALREYLGEQQLNGAIKSYLNAVKFQEPMYTNAVEFVQYLRAATPDSLKYMIEDMFETITIYENYVQDLSYTPLNDGTYKVQLTVGSTKFRADSTGKQTKVPVADYIDIGVFAKIDKESKDELGKALVMQRVKMDAPVKTFEFIVQQQPYQAGIDPLNLLIDRTPSNNLWKFGSKPPKVNTEADAKNGAAGATITIGG
jgi:ABC-2 type transport system permease protein